MTARRKAAVVGEREREGGEGEYRGKEGLQRQRWRRGGTDDDDDDDDWRRWKGMNRGHAAVEVRWKQRGRKLRFQFSSSCSPAGRRQCWQAGREGVNKRKPIVGLGISLHQPTSLPPAYHLAA